MRRRLASIGATLLALSACRETAREPEVAAIPVARARALFLEHCAICHGKAGDGHGPRRGSLHVKPPDFRLRSWRAGKTPAMVRRSIHDGRPGTDMPAWKSLSDAEIAGLASYVLGLSEASGDATPLRHAPIEKAKSR